MFLNCSLTQISLKSRKCYVLTNTQKQKKKIYSKRVFSFLRPASKHFFIPLPGKVTNVHLKKFFFNLKKCLPVLHSMWNLSSKLGIEPMPPTVEDRILTTGPQGKSLVHFRPKDVQESLAWFV